MRRGTALWLVAVGLVTMLAGAALGHARYVKSEPAAGAVVNVAPRVVRAWFTEELNPAGSAINVRDGAGKVLASGGVDLNDLERRSLIVRLKPIPPGKYTVGWRTVSADDGDILNGRFAFTVRSTK
jgi:methionine-rich copper-binding protein CopC